LHALIPQVWARDCSFSAFPIALRRVSNKPSACLVLGSERFPSVGLAVPGDRAEAGEGHVVGLDEEMIPGGAVEQSAAGAYRLDGVVVPRGAPLGMAQLQRIIEEVADAEQPPIRSRRGA
jgi:hypothetical protein